MLELTNDFHNTSARVRGKVGDVFQRAQVLRIARKLCGMADCECSGDDGTCNSRYRLIQQGDDTYELRDMQPWQEEGK